MSFDIDTDIPAIAEYARSYCAYKEQESGCSSTAPLRGFMRFLVRQTSAYCELEDQLAAMKDQVEQITDEMADMIINEVPDI